MRAREFRTGRWLINKKLLITFLKSVKNEQVKKF